MCERRRGDSSHREGAAIRHSGESRNPSLPDSSARIPWQSSPRAKAWLRAGMKVSQCVSAERYSSHRAGRSAQSRRRAWHGNPCRRIARNTALLPRRRQSKEAVPFLRYCSLKRPRSASSGQASLRHPRVTAYRCFLPDLTGFTASRRARPSHQRRLPRSSLQGTRTSRKAVNPAIADCGCRAPLVPRLARPHVSCYAMVDRSVKRSRLLWV